MSVRKRPYADQQEVGTESWLSFDPFSDYETDFSFFKFNPYHDYPTQPAPKRRQTSLCSATTSTVPQYGACLPELQSPGTSMPPPATVAPSAIHLPASETDPAAPVEFTGSNGYEYIDSILAGIKNAPHQHDRRRFPSAAAEFDRFAKELQPLHSGQDLPVESRQRNNEPWVPPTTIFQCPQGRRYSNSTHLRPGNTGLSYIFDPSSCRFSSPSTINIASKAKSEFSYPLDSGYHSLTSPGTRSVFSSGGQFGQMTFNEVESTLDTCGSIGAGVQDLEVKSQMTERPIMQPFEPQDDRSNFEFRLDHDFTFGAPLEGLKDVHVPDGPPWDCKDCDEKSFKNKSEFKYGTLQSIVCLV